MREDLDTTGLMCPLPVLEIAQKAVGMKPGDILEVQGDCPTFERDVRRWYEQMGKKIVSISSTDLPCKVRQEDRDTALAAPVFTYQRAG